MSDKYQTELSLTLKPSPRLIKMAVFVHIFAMAASIANALAFSIKISLFSLIGLHCWITVRRLNAEHITIKHTGASGWAISEGGDFVSIEILKSTVITPFALFLHFKPGSKTQTGKSGHKNAILVLNDALAEKDYRCLIVQLKTTAAN